MTSTNENPYRGLPPPVTKLTMEQDLKLRLLYDGLTNPETQKEDMITIFMALQEQNYVLSNSLTNLVKKWPTNQALAQVTINGEPPQSGTLYVIKG